MFDYEILRLIWWALLGILLIGFALTDGFDLGTAALLPFVARTDVERRMVINTIGPVWEGNQVWFILGGGAIFAAWPFVYAVSFSGFYLAMFLVLAALILRPVGFKYRSKRHDPAWRSRWDWALFVGGLVPALVFGVAVGNVLLGAPFRLDSDLRAFYDGGLLGLFSPFTLLCGLLSVAMLVLHGATWLTFKIEHGPVHDRARSYGCIAAIASVVLFALGWAYVAFGNVGYQMTSLPDPAGASNPLHTVTAPAAGAWLANYGRYPWMMVAPILGFAGTVLAFVGITRGWEKTSFGGSALGAAGHHRDGRIVDVPLHPALEHRSAFQPHRLERLFEPEDAWNHARGDGGLPADRARLHRLGLQDHVGPADHRRRFHASGLLLIGGSLPCGISPGFSGSASRSASVS
ncbi:cytochrome d ubiquinol oxidase subunit II [Sphingomonas sp. BE270]|jgi:cytochrome d ubiquinol oxidase subunit II|nr:cytochrome d ubiquinol oxidase subunit II [Sphingomonas sp. BE270]